MNISKTIFALLVLVAICASSCNRKKYNPSEPPSADVVDKAVDTKDVSDDENAVKLTIMVQKPGVDFPQNAVQALESRMLSIASKNGIVGYGGDPAFVLAALVTPLGKEVTTAPPVKKVIKYAMNLYVANIVTGDVYGSYSMEMMGIGKSFELAAVNAMESVENNSQIQSMLHSATDKIVKWFDENSKVFISRVNDYIIRGQYDKAYALLASVPQKATECFNYAQKHKSEVYEKYMQKLSTEYYRMMIDEIAKSGTEYNPLVGGYFQMIPHNAPDYKKVRAKYEAYISHIAKADELGKEREFYLEKERIEAQKLEMQAQIKASEAMMTENAQEPEKVKSSGSVVNMIVDQAIQIGVPHLLTLLL